MFPAPSSGRFASAKPPGADDRAAAVDEREPVVRTEGGVGTQLVHELVVERNGDDGPAERLTVLVDDGRKSLDAERRRRGAGDHLVVLDERRPGNLAVQTGEGAAVLDVERLLEPGRARERLSGLAGALHPVGEVANGDA